MFHDALEAAGANVRAAATGPAALAVAETWPPDLIVTDLGLPVWMATSYSQPSGRNDRQRRVRRSPSVRTHASMTVHAHLLRASRRIRETDRAARARVDPV